MKIEFIPQILEKYSDINPYPANVENMVSC